MSNYSISNFGRGKDKAKRKKRMVTAAKVGAGLVGAGLATAAAVKNRDALGALGNKVAQKAQQGFQAGKAAAKSGYETTKKKAGQAYEAGKETGRKVKRKAGEVWMKGKRKGYSVMGSKPNKVG